MGQTTFTPLEVLSIVGGAVLRQRLGAAGLPARAVRQVVQRFLTNLSGAKLRVKATGQSFTAPLEKAIAAALADPVLPESAQSALIAELTPLGIANLIASDNAITYLERQTEQFFETKPEHPLSAYPMTELVAQLRTGYSQRLRNRPALPSSEGLDYRDANLTSTDLSNANLSRVCFANAKLIYADLTGSYLTEGDLHGANCSGARLSGARLYGVNAIGVDFSGGELSMARLNMAKLMGVRFNGANLVGADLSGACLVEAVFSDANLTDADLVCADLSRADLRNAELKNADLRGAILTDAYLPDGKRSKHQAKQMAHLLSLKIPGLKL